MSDSDGYLPNSSIITPSHWDMQAKRQLESQADSTPMSGILRRALEQPAGITTTTHDIDSSGSDEKSSGAEGMSPDGADKDGSNARPNRDPISHRIIEKRRRDRMNNCLTNLSKLIPQAFLRKGRGRIEKTEIIEMAIKYMKQMQAELRKQQTHHGVQQPVSKPALKGSIDYSPDVKPTLSTASHQPNMNEGLAVRQHMDTVYQHGFFDCVAESLRFLATRPDGTPLNDYLKHDLVNHLKDHCSRAVHGRMPSTIKPATTVTTAAPLRPTPVFATGSSLLLSAGEEQPLDMSRKRPRLDSTSVVRLVDSHGMHRDSHSLPPRAGGVLSNSSGSGTGSSSSGQYPSSPGSSHGSGQGSSHGGSLLDSPPRIASPLGPPVTAFALHPSGLFYVPVKLSSSTLDPAFFAIATIATGELSQICHPVSIAVNYHFVERMHEYKSVARRLLYPQHGHHVPHHQPLTIHPPPPAPLYQAQQQQTIVADSSTMSDRSN